MPVSFVRWVRQRGASGTKDYAGGQEWSTGRNCQYCMLIFNYIITLKIALWVNKLWQNYIRINFASSVPIFLNLSRL